MKTISIKNVTYKEIKRLAEQNNSSPRQVIEAAIVALMGLKDIAKRRTWTPKGGTNEAG